MSDEAFWTEKIETDAGEYTIELFYDKDADNPLTNWDHPGMAFLITSARKTYQDTLSDAGRAGEAFVYFDDIDSDRDVIQHRFDKWRAIAGSPWILVSGSGYDQSHWWNWSVLVDSSQWSDVDTTHAAARDTMDVYQKWARGEFCGYVVTDPDGGQDDSCWGFDDDEYALSEAKSVVECAAEKRKIRLDNENEEKIVQANLIGAGIVGLI